MYVVVICGRTGLLHEAAFHIRKKLCASSREMHAPVSWRERKYALIAIAVFVRMRLRGSLQRRWKRPLLLRKSM